MGSKTRNLVVMPAFRAEATLASTYSRLPEDFTEVVVCDDASPDATAQTSRNLGLITLVHEQNRGYGANQKTLYDFALSQEPEVIVMVHPDNQYDTDCLPQMRDLILSEEADLVMGSRIRSARDGGMPLWKYIANRALSGLQNRVYGQSLSEYHSGLRAYSAKLLKAMPFKTFADDFAFDSETIAWTIANGYRIAEVDTSCHYNEEVSSIKFWPSVKYGLSCLLVARRFKRGHYNR